MQRFIGVLLLFVTQASAADLSDLKAKGLTKQGVTFVIEAEKPVLAKMKEFKSTYASYLDVANRQAKADEATAYLGQLATRRTELRDNLNNLNQQINEQGFQQNNAQPRQGPNTFQTRGFLPQLIAERDTIKNSLDEINVEQKEMQEKTPQKKERATLDDSARTSAEACKTALAELRPMIEEVTTAYTALQADATVKAAIGEMEKAAKANLKLGPSDAFKAGVKLLDQAERKLLGKSKTVATRKKTKSKK